MMLIYLLQTFQTGFFSVLQHTHTCLTALFLGIPRWAGNRKVKPIWILLKQETVSGSGISWTICKSAPRSRHLAPPLSFFTGRMPFLPPNQQRQSTEGTQFYSSYVCMLCALTYPGFANEISLESTWTVSTCVSWNTQEKPSGVCCCTTARDGHI